MAIEFRNRSNMNSPPHHDGTTAVLGGSKPTGAAAFVAREKGRGGSRVGLTLAMVGAVSLGAGLGAWALSDPTPAAAPKTSAVASATTAVGANDRQADLETQRREQAEGQAALKQQRERQAREIAESQKQLEALQKRRNELQQQVAELTAPLAPGADELEETRELDAAKVETAQRDATGVGASDEPLTEEVRPVDDAVPAEPEPAVIAAPPAPRAPAPRSQAQVDVAVDTPTDAGVRANGPVRVFIHVRARDPRARIRAQAIADDLRRRGVEVAGIRGVPHAVRNDMVRFFYDADEAAVSTLGQALETSAGRGAPITQDFRNRRIAPKLGTLEIWLS